ncbi:MAG: hypothetical protein ACD_67C00008G0004 [uncultured bacterium]|nr:MAG: hypothetical protein ACD_67C00008G0004 [uncultured bacterium]
MKTANPGRIKVRQKAMIQRNGLLIGFYAKQQDSFHQHILVYFCHFVNISKMVYNQRYYIQTFKQKEQTQYKKINCICIFVYL